MEWGSASSLPCPVLPRIAGYPAGDLHPLACSGYPSFTCSHLWPDRSGIPRKHQAHLELGPQLPSSAPASTSHILLGLPGTPRCQHGCCCSWGSRPRASPGVWRWERALWRLGMVERGWAEAGGICQDNPGQAVFALDASQRGLVFQNHHQLPGRRKNNNNNKNNHQTFLLLLESAVNGRWAVHY